MGTVRNLCTSMAVVHGTVSVTKQYPIFNIFNIYFYIMPNSITLLAGIQRPGTGAETETEKETNLIVVKRPTPNVILQFQTVIRPTPSI